MLPILLINDDGSANFPILTDSQYNFHKIAKIGIFSNFKSEPIKYNGCYFIIYFNWENNTFSQYNVTSYQLVGKATIGPITVAKYKNNELCNFSNDDIQFLFSCSFPKVNDKYNLNIKKNYLLKSLKEIKIK